ncbi:MAG: translation elongation factor Ts [bacterium]|nr:translation elongation factor Ts [bacterium]
MAAEDVAKLREQSGAGIMDCKNALEEAGGDFDKALEIIKEKGLAKAEKKGDREAGAGYLESYIHQGRVGVLLHVNAETDFVTKNEDFREMAKNIAMHISAMMPSSVEELMEQDYVKDPSMTVEQYVKSVIGKIGENINVVKFACYAV